MGLSRGMLRVKLSLNPSVGAAYGGPSSALPGPLQPSSVMTRRVPQKSVCVPGPSRVVPSLKRRTAVEVEERELQGRLQHRVNEAPGGARLAEAELRELHTDITVY